MPSCQCGCGTDTQGLYAPGHDQKLRASLEERVGGLLAMRTLVEAMEQYMVGDANADDLTATVRDAFAQKRGGL